jgi:hypothetical protein
MLTEGKLTMGLICGTYISVIIITIYVTNKAIHFRYHAGAVVKNAG